jgi:NADH-quinone oxidoreductase subunit H
VGSWVVQIRSDRKEQREIERAKAEMRKPFDPYEGGYPVPPLPGQEFTYSSRRSAAGAVVAGTVTSEASQGDDASEESTDA